MEKRHFNLRRFLIDVDTIIKKIPEESYTQVFEGLVKNILSTKKGDEMPEKYAKEILYSFQRDNLKSVAGIKLLMEASMILEEENTIDFIQNLGVTIK